MVLGLMTGPQKQVELTDLKSKTFSHGITKKTKKDLEREAEEKKRLEEERYVDPLLTHTARRRRGALIMLRCSAQALVMAEYEEAFERPQYGAMNRGGVKGSGFVKAGGAGMSLGQDDSRSDVSGVPAGPSRSFNPPAGPSRGPPTGPSAMYQARVRVSVGLGCKRKKRF